MRMLRIKTIEEWRQPTNPGLPGKWPSKQIQSKQI